MTAEHTRLAEAREQQVPWKLWGPYLSERQWGTVREDYSPEGDAWNYFPHDHARSRAYRWGEDGLAGISDDKQLLCFAVALWNGQDAILKERLFGLTNSQGNHGEDVKEYYYYLDNTPTHSYMKYLYKYPQRAYPYDDLVQTNAKRTRSEPEYELIDTGIFEDDRYFDVFVEYAKASPTDLLIRIRAYNRGPESATLHVLPTLWFRDRWTPRLISTRPTLNVEKTERNLQVVRAVEPRLGDMFLYCSPEAELLFTENATNRERLFGEPNETPYVKDAFHHYLIHGQTDAVNPERTGTKMASHQRLQIPPGEFGEVRLRLSGTAPQQLLEANTDVLGSEFDTIFEQRRAEADAFYAAITPATTPPDEALVLRQALAGMLWTKQFYYYDVDKWLEERGSNPYLHLRRRAPRNDNWHHMYNADILSMPDKWEYPWYAAWDLAFHVLSLSQVDPDFAKSQLSLMLRERYLHPNGQIPAYEWNFGDVNPPVHGWATIYAYRMEKARTGQGDLRWLESAFQKLLLNFTWWVNRKDRTGRNVFEGGFLGLDNIGVFDRSSKLPTGGFLEQADGTAWMALYCQNMLEMSLALTERDSLYVDMVLKFVEHFLWIASAMLHLGEDIGMWDEEDGFFYDVLRLPNGESHRLKVRSLVGLLPFCAVTVLDSDLRDRCPEAGERFERFLQARPELVANIHDLRKPGYKDRRQLSILDETRIRRVLHRLLDENEFLSPYGIRSLSKYHQQHPYIFYVGGDEYRVAYLPGESDSGMFGGNSNWRGPIWMPMNFLILRALLQYFGYFGPSFEVEYPTGSGKRMNLFEIARDLAQRLIRLFIRDESGRRPCLGEHPKFQTDPHWRDYVLFYEYFHGDNGTGLGASHQTGWTGLVSRLIELFAVITEEEFLDNRTQYFLKSAQALQPDSSQ